MMSEPEIIRIAVPNPFVEGRTCVYVIPEAPVTMIDTGIATERAFLELVDGLREHGIEPRDIQRVVLTHKHIDHIGNAWRFRQLSGAEILIHEVEADSISNVDPKGERFTEMALARLEEWNVPTEAVPPLHTSFGKEWRIESAPAAPLVDGQLLPLGNEHLEVIHTPGHTMGSICLRYGRNLFSGDHLLPDISSNVGGGDLKHRGLLRHYLKSLERIRGLSQEGNLRVMPGHGDPMDRIAPRCTELIEHHARRLEDVVAILDRQGGRTVYKVACELFGEMQDFHMVLGCAEANAHLEFLIEQGRVVETGGAYQSRSDTV